MEEHKTGLRELHESLSLVWRSLSLVWGSLSLVWADIIFTCFSLSENSSKTHFCPKINETQFCREFVLSFLFWTDFTDNSIVCGMIYSVVRDNITQFVHALYIQYDTKYDRMNTVM